MQSFGGTKKVYYGIFNSGEFGLEHGYNHFPSPTSDIPSSKHSTPTKDHIKRNLFIYNKKQLKFTSTKNLKMNRYLSICLISYLEYELAGCKNKITTLLSINKPTNSLHISAHQRSNYTPCILFTKSILKR